MTRNIIKTLGIVFVLTMFLIFYMFVINPIVDNDEVIEREYKYHFQVLVDENIIVDSYKKFESKLISSAEKKNVFVEVIKLQDTDSKSELIEQGIYSKVDGIACSMQGSVVSDKLCKKAEANKVALVDYGMNPYEYKNVVSVGVDERQLAILAADKICDITDKNDKILVFLNGENEKNKNIDKIIKKEFNKHYKKDRKKKNIKYIVVDKDKFELEPYIMDVLEENDDYEGIVALDSKYSTVIGNIIYNKEIDNMPHKKVVALGENDNVTYLKNSIFSYVLDIDEEDMANKVLSTLVDKKEDVKIRNYITDLLVISLDKNKVVTKTYDIKE